MVRWCCGSCLLLAATWLSCGCGSDSVLQSGGSQVTAQTPAGLLAGDPAARVASLLQDVNSEAVGIEDTIGDVLLTRLSLVLDPDATVADLTAATQAVGATGIAFSRPNSPFLDLIVPRQSSVAQLQLLAKRLDGFAGILLARAGKQVSTLALPDSAANDGTGISSTDLDHLLVTRFPAAWNVRGLADRATQKVTVLVPDAYFGEHAKFDEQMVNPVRLVSPAGLLIPLSVPPRVQTDHFVSQHGFQTVSTMAAKFDFNLSHGANPSPERLDIRAVNNLGRTPSQLFDTLSKAIQAAPGPVIISCSLGYNNGLQAEVFGSSAAEIRIRLFEQFMQGIEWGGVASQPGVAERVLLAQAAGNDADDPVSKDYPGLHDASLGSFMGTATTLDSLEAIATKESLWNPKPGLLDDLRLDGSSVAQLKHVRDFVMRGQSVSDRNLTLVGSVDKRSRLVDLTESKFSNRGASLFCVGDFITSITQAEDPNNRLGDPDAGFISGTSFSAPQVAGLAAYMWLLDDKIKGAPVEETLKLIHATSRSNEKVTNIVDAYGAVLALDARNRDLKIRKELLDVSGPTGKPDGKFNRFDLQKFEQVYQLASPGGAPNPALPDFSRFDLNGDGFTGGSARDSFDLDADGLDGKGAPKIGTVTFQGEGTSAELKEASLTDIEILWYYAYANGPNGRLYEASQTSDTDERTRILGDLFLPLLLVKGASVSQFTVLTFDCDTDQDTRQVSNASSNVDQLPPFALTAGGTSIAVEQTSPTTYSVSYAGKGGQEFFCPSPSGPQLGLGSSSGASLSLVINPRKPGLLTLVFDGVLLGSVDPVVETFPLTPGQQLPLPLDFGNQGASVTGVLTITFP